MVIFTEHALVKLKQRSIKQGLVTKTLENPDYQIESYGDRKINFKKFRKLYLQVVYKIEDDNVVIITAHRVARIKKK